MKNSNFRVTMLSTVAGILLGLAIFLSFGYTQTTSAGDICPNTDACPGGYCFTRGDGAKSCKYFGTPSGCASSCTSYPDYPGGGNEDPIDEGGDN